MLSPVVDNFLVLLPFHHLKVNIFTANIMLYVYHQDFIFRPKK